VLVAAVVAVAHWARAALRWSHLALHGGYDDQLRPLAA
jgi:hypothetical protein